MKIDELIASHPRYGVVSVSVSALRVQRDALKKRIADHVGDLRPSKERAEALELVRTMDRKSLVRLQMVMTNVMMFSKSATETTYAAMADEAASELLCLDSIAEWAVLPVESVA